MAKDRYASYCTKCDKNFEGKPKTCPVCGNKAYLRSQVIADKGIVVTDANRDRLEAHCKTRIPNDVLSVVPSALVIIIGAEEEEELAKERAAKYEKIKEYKQKAAERKNQRK